MKPNEFLFIYNLYSFEKLHIRPKNEIKLYYFIKPDWIKLFKEFFNCKDIYKVLNKNLKNDYFLNLIKDEKDEFEFSKGKNNNMNNQKTESGKISEEIESDGPF